MRRANYLQPLTLWPGRQWGPYLQYNLNGTGHAAEPACDVVMLLARRKVAFHFRVGPEDQDDTEHWQWVHFGCLALNSGNDLQERA